MIGQAQLLDTQGNSDGARAAYEQAIDVGDDNSAAHARVLLARLLSKKGDVSAARRAYLRVIESGNADWARVALVDLLNLLQEQGDAAAIREAHRIAVATGNPEAPYALVVLGHVQDPDGKLKLAEP
jgi:tetratricopeptide (TPR) repeat protein